MKKKIQILHLEDDESIVRLVKRLLESEGYKAEVKWVQTEKEFTNAVRTDYYDLILADYSLPDFDGLKALTILRRKDRITPFILFSGSIGEEKAMESLRHGATDYVLKQNITVLMPAVNRALDEAKLRRERDEAQKALIASEEKYRMLFEQAPDGILVLGKNHIILDCNRAIIQMLNYPKEELVGHQVNKLISKEFINRFKTDYQQIRNKGIVENDQELILKNGQPLPVWFKAKARYDANHKYIGAIVYLKDLRKLNKVRRMERIIYQIASAALSDSTVEDFLQIVAKEVGRVLDTTNIFVGLYDKKTDTLSFPYMKDKNDLFKKVPIRQTFSEIVIKENRPLLLNGTEVEKFRKEKNIGSVGTAAQCWLGVPLQAGNGPFGILVVQSYDDPHAYNEEDVDLLQFISKQISGVIRRKQTERRLHQLSRSMEQSPSSIVITDLDGNIEYVNPTFCQITGYEKEEAIGQNPRILKSGDTPPEEYERLWKTISNGRIWKGRFHNKRKNGQLFWEEAIIGPVTDDSGHIINYLAIKEDITRAKEAEDAFQQLSHENEQLLSAISSILIVINNDGYILRWNQAAERAFGIPTREVLGKSLVDTEPGFPWKRIKNAVQRCRKERGPVSLDNLKYKDVKGNEHFLSLRFTMYGSDKENAAGILILGEDITEWKQMQSRLNQAQKLESIGQLAAGIAHEINTPIQYIGDNLYFLRDSFNDVFKLLTIFTEDGQTEHIQNRYTELLEYSREMGLEALLPDISDSFQQTTQGIEQVRRIVRAMKEFSHPGQKEKTAVDINRALQNTIMIARNEWKYVADMKTDLDAELPTVPGYLGELNQVFLNIIINAAHAIEESIKKDEKGLIHIRTFQKNHSVLIEISDTGCGISEENKNRVFDPFFTTKEVGKGTGQGLTLAYAVITQKHGGQIWFESREKEGTTFYIELPIDSKPT